MRQIVTLLLYIIIFSGCSYRNPSSPLRSDHNSAILIQEEIKYAKGFAIRIAGNYKILTVFNPWHPPDTLASYFIYYDTNDGVSGCDFDIKIPVKRVACLSSTNVAMINLIGESGRISACSDANLIYDSVLYQRYLDGSVIDLGNTHLINTEIIIDHSPGIVMKYIYGAKEIVDEKLIEAGLSVVYNLEFMETHPLGRAEWLKFVAAFFGKEDLADSIFNSIENEYIRLSSLCSEQKEKPTVLDGSSYKGVWYAAGGKSYSARMYDDAGADYYWHTDSSKGSIPISFETIIDKQAEADYWFGPSVGNGSELLKIESRYTRLKAFREGNVYFFGKRINPNGGMDYFESGVIRPDIILKDLIWVFHPELLDSDYNPVYLEKMQ